MSHEYIINKKRSVLSVSSVTVQKCQRVPVDLQIKLHLSVLIRQMMDTKPQAG